MTEILIEPFSKLVEIYNSPEEFYKEAFYSLSITQPEVKINFAIYLYKEEIVSLEKASEIAGMSIFEFKEVLRIKNIELKTYIGTPEDIDKEIELLK
ncbi:MAG: UPF0175 family protein [Leptospiraceae bacterium]|nr:UPF0175 family protein [Leptospiraceae bacterium]MCP5498582.1 UPF0175 family protein [Leptospiraceae bacterium]